MSRRNTYDVTTDADEWLRREGYHNHGTVPDPTGDDLVKRVEEWARDVQDFVYVFIMNDGSVFISDDHGATDRVPEVAKYHCASCGGGKGRVVPKVCRRCGAVSQGGVYCPNLCGRI